MRGAKLKRDLVGRRILHEGVATQLLASLVAATICNLLLQWLVTGANFSSTSFYVFHRTGMLALGSALTWLVLLAIWAVTTRLVWSVAVLTILVLLIGFSSALKYRLRREPLFPTDLFFADNVDFLLGMVGPSLLAAVGLGVAGILTIAYVVDRRLREATRGRSTAEKTRAVRVVAVVLASGLLVYAGQFNASGNRVRASYEAFGAVWTGANQPRNYMLNGFAGGFLYNLNVPPMEKPPNYSRATMERLVARYRQQAARVNLLRAGTSTNVNIVLVLSEAFSDPLRLNGFHLRKDPIPLTRSLMGEVPSGSLLTQKLGSGTANMEFQALTGQSTAVFNPQMDTPYQMLLPKFDKYPSVVGFLKQEGYEAVAIHPYNANMYRRQVVYPILGFDRFIDVNGMDHRDTIQHNDLISDHATFEQVIDTIRETSSPLFLNVVTMQNHYAYEGKYEDPIAVRGLSEADASNVGNYARGLEYSDVALSRFLADIEKVDEPTVVIVYGDHLPAGYPPEVLADNSKRTLHETPFLLWSNRSTFPDLDLPTTSPIYLFPLLFRMLDAPIPPYYALLDSLYSQVPAMEHGLMIDAGNELVESADLTRRARDVLRDYRLVQYDLSIGERYSVDRLFYAETALTSASLQ